MLWEKENRIKDRQFDTVFIGKTANAVSFSFDTAETQLDTSYQVRIYFTAVEKENDNTQDNNDKQNYNYFKNFKVDNFIVLTEGE